MLLDNTCNTNDVLRQYRGGTANAFIAHLPASVPSYFAGFVGRGELLQPPQIGISDEKYDGAASQQALGGIVLNGQNCGFYPQNPTSRGSRTLLPKKFYRKC